jgi:hypothetical protein
VDVGAEREINDMKFTVNYKLKVDGDKLKAKAEADIGGEDLPPGRFRSRRFYLIDLDQDRKDVPGGACISRWAGWSDIEDLGLNS